MTKITWIAILFFTTVQIIGCSESTTAEGNGEEAVTAQTAAGGEFSISGKINNASGQVLHVEAITQQGAIELAKASIDDQGNFSLTGAVQAFGDYYIRLGDSPRNSIPIVIAPGDKLTMSSDAQTFRSASQFSGTSWANDYNSFIVLYADFFDAMSALQNQQGISEFGQLKFYMDAKKPLDDFAFMVMEKDPGSPLNLILFKQAYPAVGNLIGWDKSNTKTMEKATDALVKKYPKSPLVSVMQQQLQMLKEEEGIIGIMKAPEISLPGVDGKMKSLSSLKGKYVLIDFWASWCAPCRQENPNVVNLYKEFKNKNFTVFSVSLDDNKDKWKTAISQDNLSWPDHVSDLRGWQSSVVGLYGFNGIPHTVLIDPEGTIIGVKLRGATLEWKLREALEQ